MVDVYYNPESFGLVIVGELELSPPCYSFDIGLVLYRPETNRFFYVEDSGCSCPTPFESYTSVESLGAPLTLKAVTKVLRAVKGSDYDQPSEPISVQAARLIEKAKNLWESTDKG